MKKIILAAVIIMAVNNLSAQNVGIGTLSPAYKLDVVGSTFKAAQFNNTATSVNYYGLESSCSNTANYGYGVVGRGGYTGVYGSAELAGGGYRFGTSGSAVGGYQSIGAYGGANGASTYNFGVAGDGIGSGGTYNYGVSGNASGGYFAYGIYGNATGATFGNYAGYFSGTVYTTGSYTASDKKLKSNINGLHDAMAIINQLNPSTYVYNTVKYKQMNLPEGMQYGLIADEVQQIIPGAVKKAVQPAVFSTVRGAEQQMITPEVEFNTVNYNVFISLLIAGMKEQQLTIDNLKAKVKNNNSETSVLTTTTDVLLDASMHTIIINGAGGINVKLPAAASATGKIYALVNHQASNCATNIPYILFTGTSSQTILSANVLWLQSDGSNWNQIK
ncbi:hypothetical protein BH09BAC2_BH09BAC2_16130 [soil metagenome]